MNLLPNIAKLLPLANYNGPIASSLEILLLQPTPFCNINCDYCYLPNRNFRDRMSMDTIKSSVQMVIDAGLVDERLSIVWHAGEPLVLPVAYYEEAFSLIQSTVNGRFEVIHNFQTNGSLIDDAWCKFATKHPVRIGVSIDGPSFLHDLHRKTRTGKPTHAQCMLGVQRLKECGISFHVISVITADAVDRPDEIYEFFKGLGMTEVGFNIEESEGPHTSKAMSTESFIARVHNFWQTIYELNEAAGGVIQIREFRNATTAILASRVERPWKETAACNDQVLPFRIISVDCNGLISTFSPELMGSRHEEYADFIFGRVGVDNVATMLDNQPFRRVATAVMRGVEQCSLKCDYFSVCGGGAPSNKHFENNNLASTTTMYCRASVQIPLQVVLNGLEKKLAALTNLTPAPDSVRPGDGGFRLKST
jgi:uncharacterized protein